MDTGLNTLVPFSTFSPSSVTPASCLDSAWRLSDWRCMAACAMLLRLVSSKSAAGLSSRLPSPVDALLAISSLAAASTSPSVFTLSWLPPAASSAASMLAATSGSGVAPFAAECLALGLEAAAVGAAALAGSASVPASA